MSRISRGAPAKGSPHKGSWGDRYIIENPNQSKRMGCSKCIHYMDYKSCNIKPVYIPKIGYDYWKYCDAFEIPSEFIEDNCSSSDIKPKSENNMVKRNIDSQNNNQKFFRKKITTITKINKGSVNNNLKINIIVLDNVSICPLCNQKCKYELVDYIKNGNKNKKINVAIYPKCKRKYVKKSFYDFFIVSSKETNIKFVIKKGITNKL